MDKRAIKNELRTVIAVPVTPFCEDGAIDLEAYVRVLRRLVSGNIHVLTPNGNTGEFYALSPEEWGTILRVTIEAVGNQRLVVPGIGHSVSEAIEMASCARRLGIRAVMIHQPVHPFHSDDGWITYHSEIAEGVPEVAIVPYIRDASVSGEMISELASRCPNVLGVKYAVPDPLQFARIVRSVGNDHLTFVCGLAELWAPFFWIGGAAGFTSGLANISPGLSFDMYRCLDQGNYIGAMEVWTQVAPFEQLRSRDNSANNVSVVKEALCQLGLCGRAVRPPISQLSGSDREQVGAILQRWQVRA